jgi:hypothetical protein
VLTTYESGIESCAAASASLQPLSRPSPVAIGGLRRASGKDWQAPQQMPSFGVA